MNYSKLYHRRRRTQEEIVLADKKLMSYGEPERAGIGNRKMEDVPDYMERLAALARIGTYAGAHVDGRGSGML